MASKKEPTPQSPDDLSVDDYKEAAGIIGCEPAAIMAVAEVESARDAFDEQGRPTILYERHKFHQFTRGRFAKHYSELSNPLRGGYGKFSEQYPKFEKAAKLDRSAAIKACSWGKFQIMGFNWADAGYRNIEDFYTGMCESEKEQLLAFTRLIAKWGLGYHLRNHRWAAFAQRYNGPAYAENNYDTKLEAAYERFIQEV